MRKIGWRLIVGVLFICIGKAVRIPEQWWISIEEVIEIAISFVSVVRVLYDDVDIAGVVHMLDCVIFLQELGIEVTLVIGGQMQLKPTPEVPSRRLALLQVVLRTP